MSAEKSTRCKKKKVSTKSEKRLPRIKKACDVNILKSGSTVFIEHKIKSRLLYNSLLH